MGSAGIFISSPFVTGIILYLSVSRARAKTVAVLGIMFGVGVAGTALGMIALITGQTIVEVAGGVTGSINDQLGGGTAAGVFITPQLALAALLYMASERPGISNKTVAVLAVVFGATISGTTIGMLAAQANKAVVDMVDDGTRGVGKHLGSGGPVAPTPAPAAPGPSVGAAIGNGG